MVLDGDLVVIGDSTNLNRRAMIAKKLAKQGFSNIEPIECKTAFATAKELMTNSGMKRFMATLDFLERCMSGIGRADFVKAVASRKAGGKLGTAQFGNLVDLGLTLQNGAGFDSCLALIESIQPTDNDICLPTRNVFRNAIGLEDRDFRRKRGSDRCTVAGTE